VIMPDYNAKTSDINIAVVMKDVSITELKKALKIVKRSLRDKITVPLFLTRDYIKNSLDTFPMEFITMKDAHCVLMGEDVLKDITIEKEDLRRECEYQLKGKLLMIHQAYLEQALTRKGLEGLIKRSFRSLIPVFQSILRLKSEDAPPAEKKEMLNKLGHECGVDVSAFLEVLQDKETDGKIGEKNAEHFLDDFLITLQQLSDIVDGMRL